MLPKKAVVDSYLKARAHLEYSLAKVKAMKLDSPLGEQHLETLESFASRFARLSDILIAKYFRLLALEKDPAFRGSVVDLLNLAEKSGWIESAESWKRIRELRNIAAHDYQQEDVVSLYRELIDLAPALLAVRSDL